ncbi:CmcJ/NvfI family oxidoreductase [Paracraurococcus ruber]|uniref:Methyltransferase n=1 Tax=Paracraurococcus ruber TaxID=77675 RepID=A0ABS1CRM1_9PROT|nr:CmcJ/NvfI family oxidoreductase [Paracraurococcus ruber]MBK1656990.1 methyltransferase [Paracraurococcus ruber]TDG34314.1 methyltransferase [Paracraurococcus ruber]
MSLSLAERPAAARPAAIEAELNYLGPVEGRPFTWTYAPPEGGPRSNILAEPHRVPIHDLRPRAAAATLDREGFAVARGASALRNFDDEAAIRAIYYPESARILQAATGAARVHVFDHTIRRRVPGAEDRGAVPRQPVSRVHVDHTERSGPQRVRDLLPEEAEGLLRGRVQIVNLWRPLVGPVRDMPLAVCDAATVAPEDLVASDLIYPDRTGETYQVRFNPAHRWYWLPEMLPEEALLLKCYDSARDGVARFMPHTAFADPTAPADAPPRQSIEIRALLFHDA